MPFDLSVFELSLLAGAAFIAGWIDAVAGGGGLITLPTLMAAGLPVELALGTNKGQSVLGTGTSLWRYARAGLVDRTRAPREFLLGFAGALVGAALVLAMDPALLKPLVLVLLVGVALFLTLRRGEVKRTQPVDPQRALTVGALLAFGIGAWDGFFGPGTGTFLIIGQVILLGLPMTHASANAKVVNFASNLAAVLLFGVQGAILWAVALPMGLAQLCGAWLGARTTVKVGDRLVRRVVLVVSLVLILKTAGELISG